jgi:hypothetical protein
MLNSQFPSDKNWELRDEHCPDEIGPPQLQDVPQILGSGIDGLSNLSDYMNDQGHRCCRPDRQERPAYLLPTPAMQFVG